MPQQKPHLIVICGPTGVGKTGLAVDLAIYLDTYILSADSRQLYRDLNIGTAKPTDEQLKRVRHYLVNSHSIKDEFNAGDFERESLKILADIFETKHLAIVCGGSGLYIKALLEGLDDQPLIDPEIRQKLQEGWIATGIKPLAKELQDKDPLYWGAVDRNNPKRIIRALSVIRGTGKPFSEFRKKKKKRRPFNPIKIGIDLPREELYDHLNKRMDKMIDGGLFEEAKKLFPFRHLNSLQTVGYSEIFGYLEDKYDKSEAVRLLKRNSRRYAKRQWTWFRKDKEITWFHPNDSEQIRAHIDKNMIQ